MQKYEFTSVPMEDVLENPELYIIPELLGICRILWDKGIDTFQCSNYAENEITYWIEINAESLSNENMCYIRNMWDSHNPHFGQDIRSHYPVIKVDRTSDGLAILKELAESFQIQDTRSYLTNESILSRYKRHGGDLEILPDGCIRSMINPERANATLEDALKEVDMTLYSFEEGRLYLSKRALDVHNNYLNSLNQKTKKLINNKSTNK
jgi:hypothetical protein